MSTAIAWIRRDLRLADNTALHAAVSHADCIVPVYVLDPVLIERYAGTKRLAFLYGALHQLDASLRQRGSRLIVRKGNAPETLRQLALETGADALYAEEDWTPYARKRDDSAVQDLPLHLVGSPILRPPGTVLKQDGQPYTVFTPFSRKWRTFPPPAASELLLPPFQIPTPETQSLPIPDHPILDNETLFHPQNRPRLIACRDSPKDPMRRSIPMQTIGTVWILRGPHAYLHTFVSVCSLPDRRSWRRMRRWRAHRM